MNIINLNLTILKNFTLQNLKNIYQLLNIVKIKTMKILY